MRTCLFWLLLLPAAATAVEIYRCEDRFGRQVFSDQPCRAIGALPLPSERDPQPLPPALSAAPAEPEIEIETSEPLQPPAAAAGCPGPTAQALGEALLTAAAHGDLNAIAGMYHWPSAGRGASRRAFTLARQLVTAAPLAFRVVPARTDDAWLWAGETPPEQPRLLPPELLLGPDQQPDGRFGRYPLIIHAGCYWLPL
jgi:hypothetical protein